MFEKNVGNIFKQYLFNKKKINNIMVFVFSDVIVLYTIGKYLKYSLIWKGNIPFWYLV